MKKYCFKGRLQQTRGWKRKGRKSS